MNEKKIIQFPTPEERQKKELEKALEPVAPIFEEAEEEREVSVEKEIGGPESALPYLEGKERERIEEERSQEMEIAASTPEKDLERKREEEELKAKIEEQKKQ